MHLKQKSAIVMALPLILFVTLAMLQPPARAVNDVPSTQIIADSVTAQAGSTVDVNIRIANNAGILGAQLTVTYPSELALTRAKAGEAFSPLTMTKPGQFQSPCSFVWDGQELLDGDVKDGVILTLTFAVSESAAAGAVLPIRIAEAQNSIVDGDLNHVAVTIISGTVTIQDESASGIVSAIGAYQENLVRLNIVSSVEAKKVTAILAAYSESGCMVSCHVKDTVLSEGSNSVTFAKPSGIANCKAFLLDEKMCPCCPAIPVTEKKYYQVTFADYDGSVLSQQTVVEGADAIPPTAPQRDGYRFIGWSGSYTNVASNLTLTAQYEQDMTPTIAVSTVSAAAGSSGVGVTVSVRNNPGILGMTLTLSYDADMLTLKSAANGAAVSEVLSLTKPGKFTSPCNFIWDGQEIAAEDVKDGVLLTLRFDVADTAQGTCPITISYHKGDIVDNNFVQLDFAVQNGSINVTQ